MLTIASFDIGRKNFAFCVETVDTDQLAAIPADALKDTSSLSFPDALESVYKSGTCVLLDNVDLTDGERFTSAIDIDPVVLVNMNAVLDQHAGVWEACDVVLIEQQMSFGRRRNHVAVKLAQHCMSYFIFRFGLGKTLLSYPAFRKTQLLGARKGMTKPERKRWAVDEARKVLSVNDVSGDLLARLDERKKRDDMGDVIVQLQSYKVLRALKKHLPKQ